MNKVEFEVVEDLVGEAVSWFLEVEPQSIALSGGSTPKAVYERLAETAYDWTDVNVFFGDERCVPPDHPDSNFKMADEALLSKIAAHVHPMYDCDADAYTRELTDAFDAPLPRFDLAFMGLGEDGHTASLFPGDPALDVSDELVVSVPKPGMPPEHPRITLTLPVFNAAKLSIFLVSGGSKREALAKLRARDQSIPAARVDSERVIVLADRDAAGGSSP